MSNKGFYQDTFSQVHSSADIQWEDMEAKRPKKRISNQLLVLAAVIALLAVLSTVAAATDLFGLRSWLLPEKYRIVLYLFYYEEFSTKEIAEMLGVRQTAVTTRLVRGREQLKKRLKEAWQDVE